MRFNTLEEWLNWQEQLHSTEIDLGLERVASVYAALIGERPKPFTITIGGTNGKGSTAAFLENILISAGYRVGCYSSPHLLRYNERVRLQAVSASDSDLCGAFEEIDQARQSTSLSYFEFGTLAALQLFSQKAVEIQILEVGLGGRLDAINIVDADIAIVTSIGIDHCDWLGDSREQIGFEKAGIFRAAKPAISAEPDLPESVKKQAQKVGALLEEINVDFNYQVAQSSWCWQSKSCQLEQLPLLALKGDHQFRNAAAALMAIEKLAGKFPVDEQAIHQGLSTATLLGRVQWLNNKDEGRYKILLDVSHNPESAKVLAQYLQKQAQKGRVIALFSFMRDKDIEAILEIMQPVIDRWFWVPLEEVPRAADQTQIKTAFEFCEMPQPNLSCRNFADALAAVQKSVGKDDCVVIFGSFYLASKALEQLV